MRTHARPTPAGPATQSEVRRVVVVGGGFAGVAAAKHLARDARVQVTLIDRNDYHQFQPLLYQVATSQLAHSDVAYPLHEIARHAVFDVDIATVSAVDPAARTVLTEEGRLHQGDYLVIAAGSRANFFGTPGAEAHAFPLYSVADAVRLRSRILQLFDEVKAAAALAEQGALRFVVVGGGPTGVEIGGALAEMIRGPLTVEHGAETAARAEVHLVDHGHALLSMFSPSAGEYTASVLERDGVRLHMGTAVTEVGPGHVSLSDGSRLQTRCVIWGGGLQASPLAGAVALPTGRGGRIDVRPDLTVEGWPGVYVAGDIANIPSHDGRTHPQLGSVAMQSGAWAARNILDEMAGKAPRPFQYRDKGTMAMIGRNSAVAALPVGHHELHGSIAFAAWLGVHAVLMSGIRNRIDAFMSWGWDYFSSSRASELLDRSDAPRIDWDEEAEDPAGDPAVSQC